MITFKNACPWATQHDFNTTQNGDITGWAADTSLSSALRGAGVLVTNNKVYLFGGYSGTDPINSISVADIDGSGYIGSFSEGGTLPVAKGEPCIAVTRNRVFVIGGYIQAGVNSVTVHSAVLNTDGTRGNFSAVGSINNESKNSKAFVYNNRLYIVSDYYIESCPINSDGTLGTWVNSGNLDTTRTGGQVWWTGTRLYCWGGNGQNSTCRYCTPSGNNFTTWSDGPATAASRSFAQCAVVANHVYLIGGTVSGTSYGDIYRASITNGVVGTWSTGTSLGASLDLSGLAITSSRIYIIGGRTNSTDSDVVRYAAFSGGVNNYLPYTFELTNDLVLASPKESIVMTGAPGISGSMSIVQPKESVSASGMAYDTRSSLIYTEFENWEMEANSGAFLESDFELFECIMQGSAVIHGEISGSFELLRCDSYSGSALEDSFEEWTASGEARSDIRASMEAQFEFFDMTGEISWSIQAQLEDSFVKFTCDGVISKKDANTMTGGFELFTCSGEINKVKKASIEASFIPFNCIGLASTSVNAILESSFEQMTCVGEINKPTAFESIKYVR